MTVHTSKPMALSDARPSFKAVLLGDSGVGKTSLLTRWTTGSFSKTANPTVGANHQRKRVVLGNREIDIFLWDTAGQEQFQALTPLYARASSVAIVTTSITDLSSFDGIKRWLDLLQSASDELPPVVLAVNKIDLRDSAVRSADDIEQEYRGKFAAVFFVSAATDEEVDNLFMFAALAGFRFVNRKNAAGPQQSVLNEVQEPSSKCC
jgi:small GTP-binding protein